LSVDGDGEGSEDEERLGQHDGLTEGGGGWFSPFRRSFILANPCVGPVVTFQNVT